MAHKILVIDDEAFVRRVLLRQLGRAGYGASDANGVSQALDALSRSSFDLILLDIGLCDGKAEQVMTAVRESGERTPIVLMSGSFSPGQSVREHRDVVVALLAKPFGADELRETVSRALETRRAPVLPLGDLRPSPHCVARRMAEQLRSSPLES